VLELHKLPSQADSILTRMMHPLQGCKRAKTRGKLVS
jgi:hypothetical protein